MRFVGRHILATQDKLSDEECAVACYLAMHAEAPKGERVAGVEAMLNTVGFLVLLMAVGWFGWLCLRKLP